MDDDRLPEARVAQEGSLDLGQLDSVASKLDLTIVSSEVLDRSVGSKPSEVAGSVESSASLAKGIGDEALGGQVGAVEVAASECHSADEELAR